VQFLVKRDTAGHLRFAQLQGELAQKTLVPRDVDPGDLDTVYVLADWQSPHERLLARSRAVLHAVGQLGRGWRLLATAARLVPPPLADVLYRVVARVRYRIFGRYNACPLPRPEWRNRFID
jgi:predicted DCC family thiol-disulfide oxidoreductase YuxK